MSQRSSPNLQYEAGGCIAVVGRTVWLLADATVSSPTVEAWWSAIHSGATSDDVLTLLLDEGFRAVRGFAICAYDAERGSGTLIVRGSVSAELLGSEREEVRGGGGAHWTEKDIGGSVEQLVLAGPSPSTDGGALPIVDGVAAASRIVAVFGSGMQGGARRDDGAEVAPIAAGTPPVASAVPEVVPSESAELPDPSDPPRPPSFDYLFGDTISPPPSPEQSPSPVPADTLAMLDESSGGREVETLVDGSTDPEEVAPALGVASSTGGMITALPWATAAELAPLPAPTGAPPSPDAEPPPRADVADTVNRAALLAQAAAARSGPTVRAVRCQSGHLSPPFATTCRVCESALPPQDAFTAPRPTLGALRLSTGDVIPLDRGVVLGRAPDADIGTDPDRPHIVKLSSPEKDISRTHAVVRLDEWHVIVTDLGSTNGTVVTLPGQPPRRLRPNDPVVIEPGTVVSIADEISFVYEVGE